MLGPRALVVLLSLIAAGSFAAPTADTSHQLTSNEATELRTVAVPGATLHYLERGNGPLLVLVHGSLGELSDWDADAKILARNHRVVAYSRRFHEPNAPPKPGQPYSMRQHAEDLAALIRAKGGQADVVAHSYGAYTSLYAAVHHPELIRTLVLAEPPILPWLNDIPGGPAELKNFQKAALTPAKEAFLRGDMVDGMRRFINGVSGRAVFDQMPVEARGVMMRAAPELSAELTTNPEIYMPPISCSEVRRFNRPVLIVASEKSPPFFHMIAERLRTCLPNAQFATIKGVGHGGMVEPPAFTRLVEDFLSRRQGPRSAATK